MGNLALFRLVWRPAFVFILPLSGFLLVMLFVMSLNVDMERARQLDLSMLTLPLALGVLVGQTVHDLRYRYFSWTLPKLQRRLGASVIGIALVSALLWTSAYRGLGGELNAMAGFAGFLLVFMLSAVAQRAPLAAVCVALLVAGIWGDFFFGVIHAQPIAWTIFALLCVAGCLLSGFSRRSARTKLLAPHLISLVNMFNRFELCRAEEEQLKRRSRPREWRLAFVGTEIRNWVRAVEYGTFGATSRVQTTVRTYASFAFMGLCIISPAFMKSGRSFELGLEHAFHVLFSPPVPLDDPTFVPVAFFQALWAGSLVFSASGILQRGWVYPLSRRGRSLIVYRMSLRQNLRIVWMHSLTFAFYAALIVVLRGGVDDLGFMPGFFRGVIAVVILLPVAQWVRLWLDWTSPRGGTNRRYMFLVLFGLFPFACLAPLLTYQWPRLFAEVGLPIQASLLIALALASQGLYYRALTNHYQRKDLI